MLYVSAMLYVSIDYKANKATYFPCPESRSPHRLVLFILTSPYICFFTYYILNKFPSF